MSSSEQSDVQILGPWRVSTGGLTTLVKGLAVAVVIIGLLLLVTLALVISATFRIKQAEAAAKAAALTSEKMAVKTNETCRTPTVVFAAKNASGYDIVNRKTLTFTTTMTNIGDGYDNATGYFTAPHAGTYLFETSVCARKGKWVFVNIAANREALVTTGVYDVDARRSCTSATGITVLEKGDKAWVEGAWDARAALYVSGNVVSPTFTGMLLNKK